jgi:carbohydrate-selective porin OprB
VTIKYAAWTSVSPSPRRNLLKNHRKRRGATASRYRLKSVNVFDSENDKCMPFLHASYVGEGGALYDRSVSAGPGYYRQLRKELAGFSLNWSRPSEGGFGPGLPDQYTAELFYRFQLSDRVAITPDIRFIKDPALNPDENQIWVLGLQVRVAL